MSTPTCLLRSSLAQAQREHVTYVWLEVVFGTEKYMQFVDISLLCGAYDMLTYMWIFLTDMSVCQVVENVIYVCLVCTLVYKCVARCTQCVVWVLVRLKESEAVSKKHILRLRLCIAPPELVAL